MINFNVQNNYNNYNPHDGYAKFVQVYPFQSIQDIVDGEFVSTEKLERLIVNSDNNPRIHTFNKIYDEFSRLPSDVFREIECTVNYYKMIYLGKTDDNKSWFYSMVNHNVYSLAYGDKKFDCMNYQEFYSKLSGVPYDDAVTSNAMESYFDWDWEPAFEADDFTFSSAEPVDDNSGNNNNDTGNGVPGDNSGNDTSGGDSGGSTQAVDLTQQTQETLKNDPSYGGNDGQSGFDDNGGGDMNADANNMGDAPDGNDETEDDSDDDSDDEGTASKRRIRLNLVKLHTIIKDSLESMSTFTPAYNADAARRYYKIQSNLSTADDIIIRICNEQINDLTVDDLMKKYVTLCQIYDISTRSLKAFAKEYKEEAKLHGSQVKRDKTGERQKTW